MNRQIAATGGGTDGNVGEVLYRMNRQIAATGRGGTDGNVGEVLYRMNRQIAATGGGGQMVMLVRCCIG